MTANKTMLARAGAFFYILWGLLHIYAAYTVFQLGNNQPPGMVQGKLHQEAWNLLWLSVFAIVVAVRLNWHNSRLGYWLNLIVVSMTDIGFIIFVLLPGYSTDLIGPILWLLGAICTTAATLTESHPASGTSRA
jgi:hypothetical protein